MVNYHHQKRPIQELKYLLHFYNSLCFVQNFKFYLATLHDVAIWLVIKVWVYIPIDNFICNAAADTIGDLKDHFRAEI